MTQSNPRYFIERIINPLEQVSYQERTLYDINSVGCLYRNNFSPQEITLALGLSPQKVADYLRCYLRKEKGQKYSS